MNRADMFVGLPSSYLRGLLSRVARAIVARRRGRGRGGMCEPLESRQLLSSIAVTSSVLTITGNSSTSNTISVMRSGTSSVVAKVGSTSKTYSLSSFYKMSITGGNAADSIIVDGALVKGSLIKGLGGNDLIDAGGWGDTLYGGAGNDTIYGRGGNDSIYGEDGDDKIDGGSGTDTVSGGAGNNVITSAESGSTTTTTPTSTGPSITSLVLYNADTDKVIQTLANGATIDFAKIGTKRLSIVANTSSGAKSVKFGLDSTSSYRVESSAPYAIAGDTSGNLAAWTPSLGSHTVKATAYSASGATGTAGATTSIGFTVTDSTGSVTPTTSTTGAPDAIITTMDASINAGHSVFVNAVSSKLNAGSPITARYQWDFGDSGSKYNTLEGFNAAHVYDKPGTYTLKLTVTNEARKLDTATVTINVAAPSRKVIYVSSAGSDSNDGSSSRPIKSVAKANAMIADNTEVLFRRGDTFSTSANLSLHGRKNVLVGAYGTGNRPVINFNGSLRPTSVVGTGAGSQDITIQDLTLDTSYTSADYFNSLPAGVGVGGTATTIRNCQFLDVSDALNGNSSPVGVMALDNFTPSAGEVAGYFAWIQGSDQVYLGNSDPDSLYQHVLRNGGADRLLIAYNNFTNPGTNPIKSTLNIHRGNYIYIANNTLSQGRISIGPLAGNDSAERTRWVVLEGNRTSSPINIDPGTEHVMIRNNIITNNGDRGIEIAGYSTQYSRGVVDVQIINNTGVNSSSTGGFLKVNGSVNGIKLINNLYLAPNLITGGSGTAPVYVTDTDLGSFTKISNNVWPSPSILTYAQGGINYVWSYWSNQSGYRTPAEWEAFAEVGKDYYQDTSYGSSYAPSSSSIAASAGVASAGVFTDIFGNARSGSGAWTAGAVEV